MVKFAVSQPPGARYYIVVGSSVPNITFTDGKLGIQPKNINFGNFVNVIIPV